MMMILLLLATPIIIIKMHIVTYYQPFVGTPNCLDFNGFQLVNKAIPVVLTIMICCGDDGRKRSPRSGSFSLALYIASKNIMLVALVLEECTSFFFSHTVYCSVMHYYYLPAVVLLVQHHAIVLMIPLQLLLLVKLLSSLIV